MEERHTDALTLAQELRTGKRSAVETTRSVLAALEREEDNAVLTVCTERALAQAKRVDRELSQLSLIHIY